MLPTVFPQLLPDVPSTSQSNTRITQISEEQLLKCTDDLKQFYGMTLCRIKTNPLDIESLVNLEDIYTNLYLEMKGIVKHERQHAEQISDRERKLEYDKLFAIDLNGQSPKRIMIKGEAGVGKTTFVSKIAWDWMKSNSMYRDFTILLVVLLREVKKGQTMGEILKKYMTDENDVTVDQFNEFIRTNPSRILCVLDGADELSNEVLKDSEHIAQILNYEKYKNVVTIITTRPSKAHAITRKEKVKMHYAFVRITGFTRARVSEYISKFFRGDSDVGKGLKQFISEGNLITITMTPYPLFCSMICHMWKREHRRTYIRQMHTFSQVFGEMILFLKDHLAAKRLKSSKDLQPIKEFDEKIDEHLKQISNIAFNGILDDQLVFTEDDFSSCREAMNTALEVGILSKETSGLLQRCQETKRLRTPCNVSFPHKLYQEYTAGLYLVILFNSNFEEYEKHIIDITNKPAVFKNLLFFAVSHASELAKDIITRLTTGVRTDLNLIAEVAFESHDEETACLVEANCPNRCKDITLSNKMSSHVIAGYLFTINQLVK